nr:MAG: hypothetical protein [Microvirus sp.]
MKVLNQTRKRWRKSASRKRRSFKKPSQELYKSWKKHRRR